MDPSVYRLKVFDVMRQPVLLIDPHYTIVDVNSAACAFMDMARDKIIGRACFRVSHGVAGPCWHEGLFCPVHTTLESGKQTTVIHKHHREGRVIFEEIVASPIFDEAGRVEYVVEELRNVTDLIRLKEIREYLEKEIRTLHEILPICSSCKKIRNDQGFWQQVEVYFQQHSQAEFTHGYCPECAERVLQEIRDRRNRQDKRTAPGDGTTTRLPQPAGQDVDATEKKC
jgi:PAS domain S-box-containing protein